MIIINLKFMHGIPLPMQKQSVTHAQMQYIWSEQLMMCIDVANGWDAL